jgi:nucleoside-diphosphate-sugar epimerase
MSSLIKSESEVSLIPSQPSGFHPAFEKHDVDAVLHVASPYHFNFTSVQKDLIDPAVNGTLSLLNAAKDENAKGLVFP